VREEAEVQRTGVTAIVWAPSERRTELLAERLGASLHNVHYLLYKRPIVAPIKYVPQTLRTWQLLASDRPAVAFVTNPPVFAGLCVAVYSAVTRTPFVMDTHPPALYSRKWAWTVPLQRALARRALVNIVDQDRFRELFASWGARAVAVEAPPVTVDVDARRDDVAFELAVVNTFAADEPLEPLLEAARRLPDVRFAVMGDTALAARRLLAAAPQNVVFTGYLEGGDYWSCLARARAVMALTTYPHSLLSGAQDGVAVARPLLLSDQPALRDYFPRGAVFAANTADAFVVAIGEARRREEDLREEVCQLREEQRRAWESRFAELASVLRDAGVLVSAGGA
jgi:hypothetical protein